MADSNLPLQGEMALFDYLQGLVTGKTANPNYTGVASQLQAVPKIPELTGEVLNSIITEYMRGPGNYLNSMAQARQSGLYNSNTQKLVSDNIVTEAARKAALANSSIQETNAKNVLAMNQILAQLQPKYIDTSNQRKSAAGGIAISGLEKLIGLGSSAAKGGSALQQILGMFGGDAGPKSKSSLNDEELQKLLTGETGFDPMSPGMTPAPDAFPLQGIMNDISQRSTPLGWTSNSQFAPADLSSAGQFSVPDLGTMDFSSFMSPSGSSGGGGGSGGGLSDLLGMLGNISFGGGTTSSTDSGGGGSFTILSPW